MPELPEDDPIAQFEKSLANMKPATEEPVAVRTDKDLLLPRDTPRSSPNLTGIFGGFFKTIAIVLGSYIVGKLLAIVLSIAYIQSLQGASQIDPSMPIVFQLINLLPYGCMIAGLMYTGHDAYQCFVVILCALIAGIIISMVGIPYGAIVGLIAGLIYVQK